MREDNDSDYSDVFSSSLDSAFYLNLPEATPSIITMASG